jgi:prepilin-type N-terminal cleavage/methylation domain-containing protein
MKSTRGFTLIELLVVIAIIGILASVVLVSLQSARKKGNDTRVISDVQQMRTQAESAFNGTDYSVALTPNLAATTNGSGIVNTAGTIGLQLTTDANTNGGSLFAVTSNDGPKTYAIYGALPSTNKTTYFCIGSDGSTQQSTANVATVANVATAPACKP